MKQKKYALLTQVLPYLEAYENLNTAEPKDALGFANWLSSELSNQTTAFSPRSIQPDFQVQDPHIALSMLVTYLYRYAKHYIKKALADSELSTADDFTFLATLSEQGSLNQGELIQQHLLEITSGVEIIKRLERKKLIRTYPDPDDRRSKRIEITEKGKQVLQDILQEMYQVSLIVKGNLAEEEQQTLIALLMKLHHFHLHIHEQDRKSSLKDIMHKYLNPSP